MKNQDRAPDAKKDDRNPPSRFTYLIAGFGIGAIAAILLAPQSGEDTREWISTQCQNGIDTVNAQARRTRQYVGDWIDQNKQQVTEAVNAGREAYNDAKAEAR